MRDPIPQGTPPRLGQSAGSAPDGTPASGSAGAAGSSSGGGDTPHTLVGTPSGGGPGQGPLQVSGGVLHIGGVSGSGGRGGTLPGHSQGPAGAGGQVDHVAALFGGAGSPIRATAQQAHHRSPAPTLASDPTRPASIRSRLSGLRDAMSEGGGPVGSVHFGDLEGVEVAGAPLFPPPSTVPRPLTSHSHASSQDRLGSAEHQETVVRPSLCLIPVPHAHTQLCTHTHTCPWVGPSLFLPRNHCEPESESWRRCFK